SWTVQTDEPGWVQAAAELRCGDETVRLDGSDSVLVAWPFAPLEPGETRRVTVRAIAVSGTESAWSAPLVVEAAYLADDAWRAQPIGLAHPERPAQPMLVRRSFTLDGEVTRARLFW